VTSKDFLSQTTLVLDAGENLDFLIAKLNQVFAKEQPSFGRILSASLPGQKTKVLAKLPENFKNVEIVEIQSLRLDLFPRLQTPFLAYLPANAPYTPPQWNVAAGMENIPLFIQPWIPNVNASDTEWARGVYLSLGWISTPALLKNLGLERTLPLRDLERRFQNPHRDIPYLSNPAKAYFDHQKMTPDEPPRFTQKSKILAMVPHFHCEEWLEQCLYSLVNQTRPPDAIVVLDDASPQPPLDIIAKFPKVTLLRSPENGGPYRLIQSAIDQTRFDGYMFQDADDWSSLDRLEVLLNEAERTGADWIGTQELMYFEDVIHSVRYPTDLNSAPEGTLRHPFCDPSSLISRAFLTRLGGFASGLSFSGDWELLNRALLAGKVVNLDRYCYFRRIRKDSLITSEKTGLASPARREVDALIQGRKKENQVRASQKLAPLLGPIRTSPTIPFEHLAGPPLTQV